ncbi:helix-turn-helix domain-containing protein [Flagellimonas nanhaiensis]|uniref:helix-turn-helix domain-containing protein n=1 Tax=Flagellimonas nanhaiensis TaxID=2292706 RepID=UPI0015F29BB3|nr:helix-turn-helix domain-containing protein [Allomuricauda nanhaiensis]
MSLVIVLIDMWQSKRANLYLGVLDINLEYVVQFGVFLLVNIIIFQGLKKPSLFQQLNSSDIAMVSKKSTTGTKIIGLSESKETVEKHLNVKKPYLNPDLDLNTLAKELGMKPKFLSQVINEGFHTNYYDYINSYRIRDAKELLLNFRDMSIKEIMYAVGFNSRSVFNTVFKQKTGITPSRFRSLK